ncbi:deazaflavin-dependent oxidoreductase (nitroreductase family) [Nakamurella sp. UYEF19]|uniref:nitroreductase family deazaflavin-dependent oxidoreductase n=1 Tax=Nakamurella sp. UYEF19 TaxID=1756392 RepID=UPI003393CFB5
MGAPGGFDIRRINQGMVARLLDSDPQPLPDEGFATRVLETVGRSTGQVRSTPIAVVRSRGLSYLVSPDLSRDWVLNLQAHPGCTVRSRDDDFPATADPAGPDESVRVIGTYLRSMTVPWALKAFPIGPDASDDEIGAHLSTIAVFRLGVDR